MFQVKRLPGPKDRRRGNAGNDRAWKRLTHVKALMCVVRHRMRLLDELNGLKDEVRECEIRVELMRLGVTQDTLERRLRIMDRRYGNTMTPYVHKTIPWEVVLDADPDNAVCSDA